MRDKPNDINVKPELQAFLSDVHIFPYTLPNALFYAFIEIRMQFK